MAKRSETEKLRGASRIPVPTCGLYHKASIARLLRWPALHNGSVDMLRLLMVEDDPLAAELTLRALRSSGLNFECERVADEAEFRAALGRDPDLILSDSNVPGFDGFAALGIATGDRPATPFIFVSGSLDEATAQRALDSGARGFVPKTALDRLAYTVRSALELAEARRRRASDRDPSLAGTADSNETATHLLHRQDTLDRTLGSQDASTLSSILNRTPPVPVALVMIGVNPTRERFVKLLNNAEIETEVAESAQAALRSLFARVHAVLFTDQLELVKAARQLQSGSATHIVFVESNDSLGASEALRAGANEIVPHEAKGERFWAHMTMVRRLISFATSLESAVTGNRILSTIDELTHCGNRRFFEQQFPREVARAMRLHRPLAILLCDIDHFKSINDSHGHQIGDEVLSEFGDRLTSGLRLEQDWAARIGGEEFGIVLPDTGSAEAVAIAQRLCNRVNAEAFSTSAGPIPVTASFGTCGVNDSLTERVGLAERMIVAADSAMYASKGAGRNRVTDGSARFDG
jgi:two-component system, cell cycle response regulator